jgi:fumarylacetoacetate (FAA) hydrolase
MKFGDTIRIEMKGKDGASLFGAIDQNVVPPGADRGDGADDE